MPTNNKSPEYWDKKDAILWDLTIIGFIAILGGFSFGFRAFDPGFWTASEASLILKTLTGLSAAIGIAGAILMFIVGNIIYLGPQPPQTQQPGCHKHNH